MIDSENVVLYNTDNVLKVKAIIKGETFSLDFRTELRTTVGNIVKDLSEQPGKYAWYSAILVDLEDQALSKKRDIERRKEDLGLQLRQGKLKIEDQTGAAIKLTEGGIADYINNDKQVRALQDELFAIESTAKKFRILVNASIQRKDMLNNLAMLEHQERKQFNSK